MTPKQITYVQHRAAGMSQARAAIAAGYATGSAKVIASRMEKMPSIRAAIDTARKMAKGDQPDDVPQEFQGAEDYLLAVVRGTAPPDPVRVGAARALLPFTKGRQRAPVRSATPKQMQASAARAEDQDMLDKWEQRAAAVRAKMKRTA